VRIESRASPAAISADSTSISWRVGMMVTINCRYEYGMRSVPDFCRSPEQAEACPIWLLFARPGLRRLAFDRYPRQYVPRRGTIDRRAE
jgi:hypothetical protein